MKKPTILGAIIGDTVGSVYEFNPTKDYNFKLYDDMEYTDDSIMTIAVADWILHDPRHGHETLIATMRKWGQKYPCPMGSYGGGFACWLRTPAPQPYNSWGNGSAMRVSAVGYAFDTLDETIKVAKVSAEVTHNHPEGIKGAMATAAAIYMARHMATKTEIRDYIEQNFGYDLHRKYEDIKKEYHFDGSCQGTVPESIISFLESDSYEDAIRKTVALGGDADTMGSITGGIAAAYYREVPDGIAKFTLGKLPFDLRNIVEEFEAKYGNGLTKKAAHVCGVTPTHITKLKPNEVFVFGSNLNGYHGGGAARAAVNHFGAIWGVGVGIQGQSYAIPTMQGPTDTIRPYVDQFIEYAVSHPEQHFLVTPIGCGIAGFTPEDIAPLFAKAINMSNVSLPQSFIDLLAKGTEVKPYSVEALINSNYDGEFVFFWGHHEKPGKVSKACFSQWYPSTFTVEGAVYNCMEQYMMAEKARLMGDEEVRGLILAASDPKEIKALGRQVKNFDETVWDANKLDVVVKGNFCKFTQNAVLCDFILSTGDKVLVEASPYDKVWGIGLSADDEAAKTPANWKGTNYLGFALMAVRDKIRERL